MPEATNDVVWAWIGTGSPWTLLWLWLALINLVTFLVFGFDKLKAKYKEKHEGARRVPEKTLFLLAALGGSVGALLGMRVRLGQVRDSHPQNVSTAQIGQISGCTVDLAADTHPL